MTIRDRIKLVRRFLQKKFATFEHSLTYDPVTQKTTYSVKPSLQEASLKEYSVKIEETLRGIKDIKCIISKPKESVGELTSDEKFNGYIAASLYFYNLQRYDLIGKYAEAALTIRPNENNLRLWLSFIYGEKVGDRGAKQKAIDHCVEVIKTDPSSYQAKFNIAIYTSHIKGPDETILLYLEAKELMENQNITESEIYGKLCNFLGNEYARSGIYCNKNKAEALFKQAISILKRLSDKGDITSKFWIENAKDNLIKLLTVEKSRAVSK